MSSTPAPSPASPSPPTQWPASSLTLLRSAWDDYQGTVARNPWIPHRPHPQQQRFLLHSHTLEVLYGGAAGVSKEPEPEQEHTDIRRGWESDAERRGLFGRR